MPALSRITPHVFWMPPDDPDRPSLGAVIGSRSTLILDAGASPAHAQSLIDALAAERASPPRFVALTHWHWDHVFGAAHLDIPVIAHTMTAAQLAVLAGYDWSDEALDQRVLSGEEITMCAENIKIELPSPRVVQIAPADILFDDGLEVSLGDTTVLIRHVGGDHAADSCVMVIPSDRVLFIGDCLYQAVYAPVPYYTTAQLFPLLDELLRIDADYVIEGHSALMTRVEFAARAGKLRLAGELVAQIGGDEAAVLAAARAHTGETPDGEFIELVSAFIAGQSL